MDSMRRENKIETQMAEILYEEIIRRNSDRVYRLAYALVKTHADADDWIVFDICSQSPYDSL